MNIKKLEKEHWGSIKNIYNEAFPKRERKPFFMIKNAIKNEKSNIWIATEEGSVIGFIMFTQLNDMIMVEYLAVSNKIRSKGMGSRMLKKLCDNNKDKRIVLLIEKIDERANNNQQRISRKRFYIKNGFNSSGIFIKGNAGDMEVLNIGGEVNEDEFMKIYSYTLGRVFFLMSKTKLQTQI